MLETTPAADMPKAYEPAAVEEKWYRHWLDRGYFKPREDSDKEPFVVIMPPPNVTGELHIGHAVPATIEDILTRWHRMLGEPTLWLPGVDHAGIAAQVVVEKALAAEGKTRHQIGREAFEKRMWQWAEECRHNIGLQHRHLGVSCDWDRETFTLDPGPSHAVRVTFKDLYDKGLIYRGKRIINWCVRCATALSDLEVDHHDLTGHLWHIRYPYEDDPSDFVIVATTRPETLLGDTAVAVNPDDKRYEGRIGRRVIVPFVNRAIPLVADAAVDPAFGTGAVKITPAHDPVDFEVAARHGLPLVYVIGQDALMTADAGPYVGQDRFECRERIVADLETAGQMEKIAPYGHSVGHCQRCGTLVEPLASLQWFVRTEPLAKPAIAAVTEGRIKIIPERFNKVYLNWMENIRDWCISRQLWWGHRIPVWYCDCGEVIVAVDAPAACPKCASTRLVQDPDMLDTWFSSGLWPHSTLGWPEDTADLRRYYPSSVMETGYDILFFWVARMIMMGLENTGDIPFHTVYLHGLIRDAKGEKMSKVKGNVLNPLDLINEYGTDALRFAISTGTTPGNDSKLSRVKLEAARNFANKLWNAGRFVTMSTTADKAGSLTELKDRPAADRWILSRLHATVAEVTRLLEDFQFGEAQRRIHDFLWNDYCDWYIELAKIRLRAGDAVSPVPILVHVLEVSLRLLHPFMPFITEDLWQHLVGRWRKLVSTIEGVAMPEPESIMIAPYPAADAQMADAAAERVMQSVIEIVHALRNIRAENNVPAERWIEAGVHVSEIADEVELYRAEIEALARVRPLNFIDARPEEMAGENNVVSVLADAEVVVPLSQVVDRDAELERLNREIAEVSADAARLEKMLADPQFTAKAPETVVAKQRDNLAQRRDKLARLKQQLARFS